MAGWIFLVGGPGWLVWPASTAFGVFGRARHRPVPTDCYVCTYYSVLLVAWRTGFIDRGGKQNTVRPSHLICQPSPGSAVKLEAMEDLPALLAARALTQAKHVTCDVIPVHCAIELLAARALSVVCRCQRVRKRGPVPERLLYLHTTLHTTLQEVTVLRSSIWPAWLESRHGAVPDSMVYRCCAIRCGGFVLSFLPTVVASNGPPLSPSPPLFPAKLARLGKRRSVGPRPMKPCKHRPR